MVVDVERISILMTCFDIASQLWLVSYAKVVQWKPFSIRVYVTGNISCYVLLY